MADRRPDEREEIQYGLSEEDYYSVVDANIERRKQERENRKKQKMKRARKPLMILLAIAIVIGGVVFSFSNFFVVDSIEVEGNSFYTAEEIINMGQATPGKNLIYHPGKAPIIEHLEQNPSIEKVSVHRRLPSTLVIKVVERERLAAITYDGEYLIIDGKGILIKKTPTQPKITLVSGLKVSKIKLGEKVEIEDEELFEQTLSLLNSMGPNDLYFIKLQMSKNKINAYVFNSLVCKGTYEQLYDGMNKGRIHTILVTLFEKKIERGTITFSNDGYASYQPAI
ncbi:MAG: FtsQ-type POTRA domain-containing protein [Firmicutes bacterium]|nr:FtsQ-type POTRA domain-containing protein [Bacillota bacterium]